jgi:hypothetical protein
VINADPAAILDLLKSTEDVDLDAMLLDRQITGEDLGTAFTDVIEAATGRSFHAAFVLATVAQTSWPVIGGALARDGFRWDISSIGAALDAIYVVTMEGMQEEKNRNKFLALLEDETLSQSGKKRTPSQRVMSEFETMAGPRPDPAPLPGKATVEPSDSPRPRTRIPPRQRPQRARASAPKPRPS